jgi:metal-sulfur cluster biosynthetic enzyme
MISDTQAVGVRVTGEQVMEALHQIIDPCSRNAGAPGSIVEMGLVRELRIDDRADGAHVHLGITVTEPTCIMYHSFVRDAHQLVMALDGVVAVEFDLPVYKSWTEHDMSDSLKARLAEARARRGVRVESTGVLPSAAGEPVTLRGKR